MPHTVLCNMGIENIMYFFLSIASILAYQSHMRARTQGSSFIGRNTRL